MTRTVDYDTVAASYDARYRRRDYDGVEQAVVDFAGAAGTRLLEVGCGTVDARELATLIPAGP